MNGMFFDTRKSPIQKCELGPRCGTMFGMRRLIALLLLLVLFLAGCGQPQTVGGKPRKTQIHTAISLSPSTTELIFGNVSSIRPVGRTAACNWPNAISQVEIVADVKPNYERIAQIKPDLLVYDASIYNEADIAKIKQLGLNTLEMNVHTVNDYIEFLYKLGAEIGAESVMSQNADKVYEKVKQNLGTAPTVKPKMAILLPNGSAEYMIAGLKSFQADIVRNSGAEPVGPDADKFVTASVESLIQMDPDFILVPTGGDTVLADPRLQSLKAVKSKRVAVVDSDILLRAGYRVDILLNQLGTLVRKISTQ